MHVLYGWPALIDVSLDHPPVLLINCFATATAWFCRKKPSHT